jgi:hypothetical protein
VRIRDEKNSDPGSCMEKFGSGIRHGKNSDTGSGIHIPDPQHCLEESWNLSLLWWQFFCERNKRKMGFLKLETKNERVFKLAKDKKRWAYFFSLAQAKENFKKMSFFSFYTFPWPFCLFYLKTTSFLAGSINNVEVSLEESDSESTDPLDPAVSVKVIRPIKYVADTAGFENQQILLWTLLCQLRL